MSTVNISSSVVSILKTAVSNLGNVEMQTAGPALAAFFTWLAQNPTALGNALAMAPEITKLNVDLLAAQVSVQDTTVTSLATQLAALFTAASATPKA